MLRMNFESGEIHHASWHFYFPRMVYFCFVTLLFQIWIFVHASVALTSGIFLTRRSFADWIDVF